MNYLIQLPVLQAFAPYLSSLADTVPALRQKEAPIGSHIYKINCVRLSGQPLLLALVFYSPVAAAVAAAAAASLVH